MGVTVLISLLLVIAVVGLDPPPPPPPPPKGEQPKSGEGDPAKRTASAIPSYSTDLETELRTLLFTGYETLQRPGKTVSVAIALNVLTINSLDIKAQTLSTTGYFSMLWIDDGLNWSSLPNYTNIKFLFSSETYMWRPAVIIENSVTQLKVFSDTNTLIRVISSGQAIWSPGGIFETYCEADVTYYPLDVQECTITLSTWAYTSDEVSLTFSSPAFKMDHFQENGEWELIGTSTASETSTRESESYSRLYFTLKLRRRPLFHILNTLFPVILLASLIVFVFKLPPESGERVGMSLTVLLAYAVYLTLISDNIPQTSLSASILSTYLTIILMLSTLSVVFTIFVLDIYFNHEDDEEMPPWVQTFTRKFLVKIAMWKGNKCCSRDKKKVKPENDPVDVITTTDLDMSYDEKEQPRMNGNTSFTSKLRPRSRENSFVSSEGASQDDQEKYYSWKEVALILDRVFMYTFIFMVTMCTLVCLIILCSQFSKA